MIKLFINTAAAVTISAGLLFSACNSEASKEPTATNNASEMNTDTVASKPAKKMGRVSAKMDAGVKGAYKKDASGVYSNVEVQPQYPGGEGALSDFMANTIVYPETAIDQNVEGTVRVEFVVNENGKVTNARAAGNALGSGLEQAAVDVINKMPEWTPGKVNGKNVKTRLVLPVTYKIE